MKRILSSHIGNQALKARKKERKNTVLPVVFFLLLIWPLLSGMGMRPGMEVPEPEIDFRATAIDDQDISTKCTKVSWEGETFFRATRGKAIITIAFEKVKKVARVGEVKDDEADFQITLRDGHVVAVTFDSEQRFFGTTEFGTYRIPAKYLKEIVFE
jgi:hypothetical protein